MIYKNLKQQKKSKEEPKYFSRVASLLEDYFLGWGQGEKIKEEGKQALYNEIIKDLEEMNDEKEMNLLIKFYNKKYQQGSIDFKK